VKQSKEENQADHTERDPALEQFISIGNDNNETLRSEESRRIASEDDPRLSIRKCVVFFI
jgi:hypothetical protein